MIKIWGHRGAKGYYPENTLASFEGAIKQKVDGIELDVHLSKDGYLIVCHDETLNRTTNGKGFIKNLNLYELKQLDAGSWFDRKYKGEKLPLLDEVFERIKGTNIDLNIEIKAGSIFYPGIEEKLIKMIDKFGIKEQVVISSFDIYSLNRIKEIDNSIKTSAILMDLTGKSMKYIDSLKVNALHLNYNVLDKDVIAQCTDENIDINVYSVNSPEIFEKIKDIKMNAIITDYPDVLRQAMNK